MASKFTENMTDNQLPDAVIAQAEAAILGNIEEDSPISRQPSNTNVEPSQYPLPLSRSSTAQSNLASTDPRGRPQASSNMEDSTASAFPAFGQRHDELDLSQDGFDTKAKVTDDGRINININQKTRRLSNLLAPALRSQLSLVENETPLPPGYIPPALGGLPGQKPPPKLNVVMHVVGSRGDVQPFIALGKTLKSTYGHRVRLATHPTFQSFVEENGLEFFSISGDPKELMSFMVKNPGLMPGLDSLKSGDVGKRRKNIEEIILGCWRSCIEAGKGTSGSANYNDGGINMDTTESDRPFIADAIIANPPSFAHIHIAEKLGVPLHIMFTMPWTPTQSFPHPLANIQSSNADVNMTNFMTYALVEMMTWQGLGDIINRFRERALGLDALSLIWAPGILTRLRVPFTYCWSPALIPKPKDWGQQISISGFFFLSLASAYTPDPELAAYLAAGPPPLYIGFGSIVVDDPNAMTKLIFEAVKLTGKRALVSKGWGGLGADSLDVPEGVFMLGNVPHDWLFNHVSCVVHHGGAGTTAAGIALGKPTVVIPFFGDQPFWGAMVARAGAGPVPIPFKDLTAEKLAASIEQALKPATLERAKELGAKIANEKGTEVGAKAFHDQLDVENLRCSLAPSRVAVWRIKRTKTRLSALAATVLSNAGLISFADLKLYRGREYDTDVSPSNPILGGAGALLGTMASLGMGVADFPLEIFKGFSKRVKDHSNTSTREHQASRSSHESTASRSDSQADLSEDTAAASSDTEKTINSSQTSLENTRRSIETPTPISPSSRITSFVSRGSSLKEAFKEHRRSSSRSSSPSRLKREVEPSQLSLESAIGAGKGLSRIVGAGLKSPMDFTLGLARGFHNAPKLYGDDTVRPQEKVVDFSSGLKAAGKEFGYGFYDGISGLITQPLRGAEKEGAAGLFKGIGRGIGGLVLKPGAAIWGLPGYTFMGIHKEIRKMFGSSVQNYIISARTAKGYEDFQSSTAEERQDIIDRWRSHKAEYQSVKQKILEEGPDGQNSGHLSPKGFMQTRHLTFDERKKLHAERLLKREVENSKNPKPHHTRCPSFTRHNSNRHDTATNSPTATDTRIALDAEQNEELEAAIQSSVAATSKGNIEQDAVIEKAIRASIAELQRSSTLTEEEALEHAITASIVENNKGSGQGNSSYAPPNAEEVEHSALLERSIQLSLQESRAPRIHVDVDSDDDEDIKRAIEQSKDPAHAGKANAHEPTEEEMIVLEYVKKQSLAEEEHKIAMMSERKKKGIPSHGESNISDSKDELERAIQESKSLGS